jgi:cytoskeletal protein CcmA (bactofilin family)
VTKRRASDSYISEQMKITGEIRFRGVLRIDGVVEGAVRGDLVELGPSAYFVGELDLQRLECHGRINGQIKANHLHLYSTGRISGSVAAVELSMEAGAELDGPIGVVGSESPVSVAVPAASGRHGAADAGPIAAARPAGSPDAEGTGDSADAGDGADHGNVIESLVGAMQGGSRLVVVVSDNQDGRASFCNRARTRLADFYQVIAIDSPTGSVRDILFGLAQRLSIDLLDQSTSTALWEAIRCRLDGGLDGKQCLLFIENGETMFPATLEGLLRLLAETATGSAPPLILTGTTDLKKMQDVDPSGPSIWEPDCLFELPL